MCLDKYIKLNIQNIDDLVFVSKFSTACFTPKMLLGAEPTIIFVKNLYKNYVGTRISDALIEKLRESYEHKDRIYVPNSYEELKFIIHKLEL